MKKVQLFPENCCFGPYFLRFIQKKALLTAILRQFVSGEGARECLKLLFDPKEAKIASFPIIFIKTTLNTRQKEVRTTFTLESMTSTSNRYMDVLFGGSLEGGAMSNSNQNENSSHLLINV